jgi:hypothetical protein
VDIRIATGFRERLIGLAFRRSPPPWALLFPRCRSVHTVGMRFALDLVWLDADGSVARIDLHVRPWRFRACAGASAVLEIPSPHQASSPASRPGA